MKNQVHRDCETNGEVQSFVVSFDSPLRLLGYLLGLWVVGLDLEGVLQVELSEVDLAECFDVEGLELGRVGPVQEHILQDVIESVDGVKLKGHSVGKLIYYYNYLRLLYPRFYSS